LSYEWFSIITTTMLEMSGRWSVPAGASGWGRVPAPDCLAGTPVVDGAELLDDDADDEVQAFSPREAAPTNPPRSARRERIGRPPMLRP
jgi:hypothetical protein